MRDVQHIISIMYEAPRPAHPSHHKVRFDLDDIGIVYRQKSYHESEKDDHEGRWIWETDRHCSLDPEHRLATDQWVDRTPTSYDTRWGAVLGMLQHLDRVEFAAVAKAV
jgi:hypothetical protein